MTEKEYFEKLKNNPKWDNYAYNALFTIVDNTVVSVEGKWFQLKGPQYTKAKIIDTSIRRDLLELFVPQPSKDYALLSQLKLRPEDLKKLSNGTAQSNSDSTPDEYKEIEKFINPASSTYVSQQVPKMPQKKLPKKSVEITLGMFFDGTGNNRYNTELIHNQLINPNTLTLDVTQVEKLGKMPRPTIASPINPKQNVNLTEGMLIDPASSFLNPYSNIVLLHDLYITRGYNKKVATSQRITFRQYVQGIGTLTELGSDNKPLPNGYKEDDIYGSASGRGKRGVIYRVEEGIENAVRQIAESLSGISVEIRSITIDVFGFSRGATAARHFVNEILKPEISEGELGLDENGKTVYLSAQPKAGKLGQSLVRNGLNVPQKIEMRFTGLFETVITDAIERGVVDKEFIELAERVDNPENVVYEKMQGYEEIFTSLQNLKSKVMHLVGMDEYRYNFPLTICDAPNLFQMYLYGSHSDIGGGYAQMDYNTIIDYKDIRNNAELLEYQKVRDSFRNRFAYGISQSGKLAGKFVYYKGQIELEKLAPHIQNNYSDRRGQYPGPPTKIDHYILKDRRFISNKISLVSFNAMLEYAMLQDVPFERDLKKANVPNEKFYHLPSNDPCFMDYFKWANEVVKNSKKGAYNPTKEIYHTIYNRYIHISAHFNSSKLFKSKGTETGPGDFYVNQPMHGRKRSYLKVRVPRPRKYN